MERFTGSCGMGALLLSLGLAGVPRMAKAAPAAVQRAARTAASPHILDAVTFHTTRRGWLGGVHTILATADGGQSWKRQYSGTATITQLVFVTNTVGWALGKHVLLHTTNGGHTWTPAGEPPQPLQQIDFVTPTQGWGVAGADLYHTTDGGHSWQRQPTPFAVGAVCFVDATHGWAARASSPGHVRAVIVASTDGGAAWHATALPPGTGGLNAFGQQKLGCAAQHVVWDLVIYGGYAGGVAYELNRSGDGGAHWRIAAQNMAPGAAGAPVGPPTMPGGLAVVSGSIVYLAGACGACDTYGSTTVGRTTDGGRTWHNRGVPGLPAAMTELSFPTVQDGWLIANTYAAPGQATSAVLQTTDGGVTWQRRYPAPQGTAQVTFTLSLYGHVPEGEEFAIVGPRELGGGAGETPFCTTITARVRLGVAACTGTATVYARSVAVPRGSSVQFAFVRYAGSNRSTPDVFYQGNKTVNKDTTIGAYYRFAH